MTAASKGLLSERFETPHEAQLARETGVIAGAPHSEDSRSGLGAVFGDGEPEFVGR